MTKEMFVEMLNELNDEQMKALVDGINQITFEYGWNAKLDYTKLIQACLEEE
jgi:hypothetical protein